MMIQRYGEVFYKGDFSPYHNKLLDQSRLREKGLNMAPGFKGYRSSWWDNYMVSGVQDGGLWQCDHGQDKRNTAWCQNGSGHTFSRFATRALLLPVRPHLFKTLHTVKQCHKGVERWRSSLGHLLLWRGPGFSFQCLPGGSQPSVTRG